MKPVVSVLVLALYAVGMVAMLGGAYGAIALVIGGGPILNGRFFLAVCGSLMLVGGSALADWLLPPKKAKESPEGMLR